MKKDRERNLTEWAQNCLLLVAALVVSFLLGEGILRLFYRDQVLLFPRYHAAAQYGDFTLRRLRPNTVFQHTSQDGSWTFTVNSQGFRNDRDFSFDKPNGRIRVISLGDSHTSGFEVRQQYTFSAVCERALRAKGVDAEVLNAGVSGFSTAEELVFLENAAVRYHPDAVIIGFFGNDFEDNIKSGIFRLEGDSLLVAKKVNIPGTRVLEAINSLSLLRWLSENSYFYSFVMNKAWDAARTFYLRENEKAMTTEYAIPLDVLSDYKKRLMMAIIKRMHTVAKTNGIKLVFIDIPVPPTEEESQMRSNKDEPDLRFTSSVPPDMVNFFREHSDAFIDSNVAFADFRNIAELHVPHGHRHISEFSHTVLGIQACNAILGMSPKVVSGRRDESHGIVENRSN